MNFSAKLAYLIQISGTSNKGLSQYLHVDPSRISQLRTGKRGRPKDEETLRSISSFFARYCTSSSQRLGLSEAMGTAVFSADATVEDLSESIFEWLMNSPVSAPASDFEIVPKDSAKPAKVIRTADNQEIYVFFGNEGKRNAVRFIYQHAFEMKEPKTVYICTEENPTWYSENPYFLAEQEALRLRLVKKGFRIKHILDLNTTMTAAFENILHWIPAYLTGNVEPYYYPRIRDGVFHQTLILIPGEMSLVSRSIANSSTSRMTLVSTHESILEEDLASFFDYFKLCVPAMRIYRTHKEQHQCICDLNLIHANRIQKFQSLSTCTFPMDMLKDFSQSQQNSYRVDFARHYMDCRMQIKEDLALYENIEICPLATAQQIRAGKVRTAIPSIIKDEKEFYTPQTYALHLKSILLAIEKFEKYYFIPVPYDEDDFISMRIKEGKKAVLLNSKDGPLTLETEQTDMVNIFQEYLIRSIHTIDFRAPEFRQQTIAQLNALITELSE